MLCICLHIWEYIEWEIAGLVHNSNVVFSQYRQYRGLGGTILDSGCQLPMGNGGSAETAPPKQICSNGYMGVAPKFSSDLVEGPQETILPGII